MIGSQDLVMNVNKYTDITVVHKYTGLCDDKSHSYRAEISVWFCNGEEQDAHLTIRDGRECVFHRYYANEKNARRKLHSFNPDICWKEVD